MTFRQKEFLEKYPIEIYGSTFLKILLNDQFRMELSEEDLKFLKAFNMISDDDFELAALRVDYLAYAVSDLYKERSQEFINETSEYLDKNGMLCDLSEPINDIDYER